MSEIFSYLCVNNSKFIDFAGKAKKEEKKQEKKPQPKKETPKKEVEEELDETEAILAAEPKSKDPFDSLPKG